MFNRLDQAKSLTGNQMRIIAAAIIGDMLEFFDYFLIGFVLAFIIKPWHLTFGQSAFILLSFGVGAILGAAIWGRIADVYGRRKVFIATIVNFSLASFVLGFTPEGGWVFLAVFRFFVGFGVGGLYCVDLPLVQEFVPARMRGRVGGLVTVFIPLGVMIASSFAAFATGAIGWRGLFLVGVVPATFTLVVRAWVPESPHWLAGQGRREEARRSLAWALQVAPDTLPLPDAAPRQTNPRWGELFRYPRSMAVAFLSSIGAQTASYGITLWAPTLFVLQLGVTPAHAAYLFLWVQLSSIAGRLTFAWLSDALGRRRSGMLVGFGGAAAIAAAGLLHNEFAGGVSLFWLGILVGEFFYDGGFALIGPYLAEVWPVRLRTTGIGRLRLRRHRQDHRPARAGGDRRHLRRRHPEGHAGRDRPRLRLLHRLDGAVRLRLPVLRLRDRPPVDRRDRRSTGGPRPGTGGRVTRMLPTGREMRHRSR